MKSIEEYNLRENPFQYITANPDLTGSDKSLWFGLPKLKSKLESLFYDIENHKSREVVLNWGPYGGGKTFAAYHYLDYKNENFDFQNIYIRSPKQGNKAASEFYKSIINYLSFRKISKQVKKLKDLMGEDELFDFLHKKINSEELSEAIILLGSEDKDVILTMRRYIYDGLTKSELKNLGLAKNIDSGTDNIKFLSGICHCFIGDHVKYKGKVVLWIDEMEDMIYYSQKEYRSFSQVLRDLMDSLNEHFAILMNFTLAESEESTIQVLLGEALWSRITRKIRFTELSEADALEYAKEAIHFYQIKTSDELTPFSEPVLEQIISLIPSENITPREINRVCGGILKYAQKNGEQKIDTKTVSNYFQRIEEDE